MIAVPNDFPVNLIMTLKDQNTKERILEIAERLIMSRGYNGFSYKDISTELNVKNAAIHYHYPSKTDLGIAVIRAARSRFRKWRAMIINQEIAPLDMLNSYFETYINYLKSGEYVCLGGSLETDFHTFPEVSDAGLGELERRGPEACLAPPPVLRPGSAAAAAAAAIPTPTDIHGPTGARRLGLST